MSNSEAWGVLIHIVVWTPQIIWGFLAVIIFSKAMQRRRQIIQWEFIAAYAMVLGAIIIAMEVGGVPPFLPTPSSHNPSYSKFSDESVPSIIALMLLVFLHIVTAVRKLVGKTESKQH